MEFVAQVAKATLTVPTPSLPTVTPPKGHHHRHGPSDVTYVDSSKFGHSVLAVITALFGVAILITFILSRRVAPKNRLFHYITLTINSIAFTSYLAMALGLGAAYVPSYSHHGHVLREVFYARYIDWLFTTPLLLLDLALLAGLPLTTTILTMFADVLMIVTGLIGGLSRNGEAARWVFFTLSCIFFVFILYVLLVNGRGAAKSQSNSVQSIYTVTMAMTVILWTAYPIVFAITEGKGLINANSEILVYGILDVLAKIVFGMYLLIAHSHTEGSEVELPSSWTEPRGGNYGAISQDDA